MRCNNCPAQWCEENESTYPAEYGCFYGEEYLRKNYRDFADGSDGCLKRLKTIERDVNSWNFLFDPKLFEDVKLQISTSYTYKRIIYNDYLCNWSKPHIYRKGEDCEQSLCGKHHYVKDGGCEVDLYAVRENLKSVCKKCFEIYLKERIAK